MPLRQAKPLPQPSPAAPLPLAQPLLPPTELLVPYLVRIDEARWYTNFGPLAGELESRLARRFDAGASVCAVSSGTQALALALRAATGGAAGYCALPAWTFVASAHAAVQAGLEPWFVDVDPETWMLDPDTVQAALASAPGPVAAIVPVCAFGRLPDFGRWLALREETGIPVVLDAAAAFDSLASAALPAAVSLHATKVLGCGEGGFVVSADPELTARVRQLSSFGFRGSRESLFAATNAKLSEYAAAVGHASLDAWPTARGRWMTAARRLRIALMDEPRIAFQPGWGSEWITSVCVVGLPEDSAPFVGERLAACGVPSRSWWGEGCHRQAPFAAAPRTDLTHTDHLARSTLGLPFAIDLEPGQIDRIAEALIEALRGV